MEPHTALILIAFIALVMVAVVCDLRTRRIPNSLVLAGMALGLLFQTVAPERRRSFQWRRRRQPRPRASAARRGRRPGALPADVRVAHARRR